MLITTNTRQTLRLDKGHLKLNPHVWKALEVLSNINIMCQFSVPMDAINYRDVLICVNLSKIKKSIRFPKKSL